MRNAQRSGPEVLHGMRLVAGRRLPRVRLPERPPEQVLRRMRRRVGRAGERRAGRGRPARHGAPAGVDPVRRPRRIHEPRGGARSRGGPRAPHALLRRRPRHDRAVRRARGEVHRGRRDGRVGDAHGARGRRGARRPCGPRTPRRRRGARHGRGRRAARTRGRPHGRGGRDGRSREPGDRGGRPREHGLPAPVLGRARRRPGRRGDVPGRREGDRVRARRRPHAQGEGGAGRGVASAPGRRRARRRQPERRDRAAVRRARGGAAPDQGAAPFDGQRTQGATGLRERDRRDREVPPGVGVREVRRRPDRGPLLAPGPVPRLRRRRRVLGARRDGPDARGHRGDRRSGRRRPEAHRVRRTMGPGPGGTTLDRAEARAPARAGGGAERRSRGALRRVAHVLRAHRGAGHHGDGLRGSPVGRRRDARLHRVDARVVQEPADPDRDAGPSRARRAATELGLRLAELQRLAPRAAPGRRDDRARDRAGPWPADRRRRADRRPRRGRADVRGRDRADARGPGRAPGGGRPVRTARRGRRAGHPAHPPRPDRRTAGRAGDGGPRSAAGRLRAGQELHAGRARGDLRPGARGAGAPAPGADAEGVPRTRRRSAVAGARDVHLHPGDDPRGCLRHARQGRSPLAAPRGRAPPRVARRRGAGRGRRHPLRGGVPGVRRRAGGRRARGARPRLAGAGGPAGDLPRLARAGARVRGPRAGRHPEGRGASGDPGDGRRGGREVGRVRPGRGVPRRGDRVAPRAR